MIADIERLNIAVLIVGSIASFVIWRELKYAFSFASGSAIVAVNFRFIRRMVERTLTPGMKIEHKDILKVLLKYVVLSAVILVALILGKVNFPFFVAGLSTVVFSIIMNQLYGVFRTKGRKEDGT